MPMQESISHDIETDTLRHSMAHVLAAAVCELYPGTRLGFGPATENGFYYDFDFGDRSIEMTDLKKISKRMKRLLSKNTDFVREEFGLEEALRISREMDQPYKVMQIQNLNAQGIEKFSFYRTGDFRDLCEGPHVPSTAELRPAAFQVDRIAGAYWLGSEQNKMLTRIYALCFRTETELHGFLEQRKIAEEHDHKKLARELDLFVIDPEVGKGLILWTPNGTVLREEIEKYAKEMEFEYGYRRVATPHIARESLFRRSGHLPAYEDSMFPPIISAEEDGSVREKIYLKPMNCPFHHKIFASRPRSYRDLPLRLAEYGTVYRFEQSGELSGLIRVRGMTMNDAHIYCPEEKLEQEIHSILEMYRRFYRTFELKNYYFRLSVRGAENRDKFIGDPRLWDKAETILSSVLRDMNIEYRPGEGEAAFYGPKIDIQFTNLLGREETVSTIQVDFQGPGQFDLSYVGEDGAEKRPVIIHRAPLSTHERFISFLIEFYGGAFPLWLAPLQVAILPVSDAFGEYCESIASELTARGFRAFFDSSDNSLNKKIRTHSRKKIPVMLIIGQKEAESGELTVRRYGRKEQEQMKTGAFLEVLEAEKRRRTPLRKTAPDA
jgi:threonyl-tRNA synthetase